MAHVHGAKRATYDGGLSKLADQVERLAKHVNEIGNEAKKNVATAVLTDLAQVTPADVGTAISNWQVSLSAPVGTTIPAYAPSPKGRMVKGVWTHAVDPSVTAQANVPPTLQAGKAIIAEAAPGQPIFITNNAPYINRLDQGYSKQAPAGFIDRAVVLARVIAAKTKVSISRIINL